MTVSVKGNFDITDLKNDLDTQINGIFSNILTKNIPAVLKKHKINNPKSYTLILKNRGSTRKRQLSTIQAKFLKLGAGQPRFDFIVGEGSYEDVIEVALEALTLATRRAPKVTMEYAINLSFFVVRGNYHVYTSLQGLKNYPFKPGDKIVVTSTVPYATALEAGFYKKYYITQDLPGGILHKVAKDIYKKNGDRVAVAFRYLKIGGTLPCIVLGPLGQFAPTFTAPGGGRRRSKRRQYR